MSRSVRSLRALGAAAVGLLALSTPAGAGGTTPNDPVFEQGLQWGLDRIGAPTAWARATGEGVTIAVVDSGVDLQHEDLADKVVAGTSCIDSGGDAARCSGSAQDDNGHGSHVAGIALAATDNGRGIAGVAPDADLMAVRVLANSCDGSGCEATGSADDVAAGIRWAADHGADIINLSLGGGALQGALGCPFCDAVEYAWGKGAISVIAAGNDAVLPAGFGDEHAVVVTATTRDDERASYSSASSGVLRAARWPISAPGGEGETNPADCATGGTPKGVLSLYWVAGRQNEYACLAGTSMAAPHVSGSLALLLSLGQTPQAAIDRLLATAKDLGRPGRDEQFGVGRVDLARAVGSGPGASTTSTTAGATSTTEPGATSTTQAPPSTAPGETTTAPPVSTPEPVEAAPFTPAAPPPTPADDPPGWLVALAVAALVASGTATATTAWRAAERRGSAP
jgi:subtilisin family serine protease